MPAFNPPPKTNLIRHRQLSPNASVRVSPLCLGAMTFGESNRATFGELSKEEGFGILDTFYAAGGNFIDTANAYQNGESEKWLGEWMSARGNRDQMVIATKYSIAYRGGNKDEIHSNFGGNGAKSMKHSIEQSFKNLQTDYIDLFYVHWWDYSTSIPELIQSLNDLVSAGKVLYLGASDCPAWFVSSANQYARSHGLRTFVVYQGMWNAGMRDFERDIIPMCRFEGMALAPYGVLGQGRFQIKEGFESRERNNPGRHFIPLSTLDKQVSAVLESISKAKGCKLLDVALAYVMQKTPYVFPIVGARKVDHIQGCIEGLGVNLSDDEIQEIEKAYPFEHGFPHSLLNGRLWLSGESDGPSRAVGGPEDVVMLKGAGSFDWVKSSDALRF